MTAAKSLKGSKTKSIIIKSAKLLFKEKGFAKTSVLDICNAAGVKAGTFTYHFNTKDDLVRAIYAEVFGKCYEFVDSKLDRELNSVEKNTFVAFLYFHALLNDPQTSAFHHEILIKGSVRNFVYPIVFPLFEHYNHDLNLNLLEKELTDIDLAVHGISREIVTDYLENPGKRSIIDIVNTIYIFRARIFTIDENLMKVYLFNGMEFERNYDHTHIRLL